MFSKVGALQSKMGNTYIQLPSAFPPPCPLVLLEHRWPAALGDKSVLCLELCRPKMAKNNTECWPFFAFSFLRSSACMGSKHHQNLVQKLQKRGKNGGLGWFWGLLGELLEAFGPQHGPKLKKAQKRESVDPPPGTPRATLKSSEIHESTQKEREKRT